MEKVLEEMEEKKTNRWVWVVVSLLVAIILALIVLTAAGVNVFNKAKEYGQKIPVVSEYFTQAKQKANVETAKKVAALESELNGRETEIDQLKSKMANKDQEIEKLQLDKQQLEGQINELTAIQEENKRSYKDIVKTYETMSAKKAAPILTKMTQAEALRILSNIKADTLAAIMEKMDPQDAARFTELLATESKNADSDPVQNRQ